MDRLKEPSTWVGVVGAAVVAGGYTLAPEQIEAIAVVVAGIASLVLIAIRERR